MKSVFLIINLFMFTLSLNGMEIYNTTEQSCYDVKKNNGNVKNGYYFIQPISTLPGIVVYCDMEYDGGGWTLIESYDNTITAKPFEFNVPNFNNNIELKNYRLSKNIIETLVETRTNNNSTSNNTEWLINTYPTTELKNIYIVNGKQFFPTYKTYSDDDILVNLFQPFSTTNTLIETNWVDDTTSHFNPLNHPITIGDGSYKQIFVRKGGNPNSTNMVANCDDQNNIIVTDPAKNLCTLNIGTQTKPVYKSYIVSDNKKYILAAKINGLLSNWKYDSLLWTSNYGINYDNNFTAQNEYKSSAWFEIPFEKIGFQTTRVEATITPTRLTTQTTTPITPTDDVGLGDGTVGGIASIGAFTLVSTKLDSNKNITLKELFNQGTNIALDDFVLKPTFVTMVNDSDVDSGCSQFFINSEMDGSNIVGGIKSKDIKMRFGIFGEPNVNGANCNAINSFIGVGTNGNISDETTDIYNGSYYVGWLGYDANDNPYPPVDKRIKTDVDIWIKPSSQYLGTNGTINCVASSEIIISGCPKGYYENKSGECQVEETNIVRNLQPPQSCTTEEGSLQNISFDEYKGCVFKKNGKDVFFHKGDIIGTNQNGDAHYLYQINDGCTLETLKFQTYDDNYAKLAGTTTKNTIGTYTQINTTGFGVNATINGIVYQPVSTYLNHPTYKNIFGFYNHENNGKCIKTTYSCDVTTGTLENKLCFQKVTLQELPVYKSCLEIKEKNPKATSGLYDINPRGFEAIQVWCDMDFDGGGWTMIAGFANGNKFKKGEIAPFLNYDTFGDVNTRDDADYKNKAYYTLPTSEILIDNSNKQKVSYKLNETITEKSFYHFVNKNLLWTTPYGAITLKPNMTEGINTITTNSCHNLNTYFNFVDSNVHTLSKLCPGVIENGDCIQWLFTSKINDVCPTTDGPWVSYNQNTCKKKVVVDISLPYGNTNDNDIFFGPTWANPNNSCSFINSPITIVNKTGFDGKAVSYTHISVRERKPNFQTRSCVEIKEREILGGGLPLNGVFSLQTNSGQQDTYCDMISQNGPWTLIGKISPSSKLNISEPLTWFQNGSNQSELTIGDSRTPTINMDNPISGFGVKQIKPLLDSITKQTPDKMITIKIDFIANQNTKQRETVYISTTPVELQKWFVNGDIATGWFKTTYPLDFNTALENCINNGGTTTKVFGQVDLIKNGNTYYAIKYDQSTHSQRLFSIEGAIFTITNGNLKITNKTSVIYTPYEKELVYSTLDLNNNKVSFSDQTSWGNISYYPNTETYDTVQDCGPVTIKTKDSQTIFEGLKFKSFGYTTTGKEDDVTIYLDGSDISQYSGFKTGTNNYNLNEWEDGIYVNNQNYPDIGSGALIWFKERDTNAQTSTCLNTNPISDNTISLSEKIIPNLNGCIKCGIGTGKMISTPTTIKLQLDYLVMNDKIIFDEELKNGVEITLPMLNQYTKEIKNENSNNNMILTITTEGELLLSGKPEAVKAANICTDGIFNSEYRNCLNTLPPEEVTIAYQTLDFTTWRQGGPLANGLWKLQDGNSAIFQSINGNPTYFLSPEIYKYGTFKGSFQVKTNSDDDWIGFVFGYKNDYDYYLIDWKKGNQSPARKGWVLSNYFGGTPVWGHESYNPGETVFFKNYGDGWIAYTSYDIVLEIAEAGYIRVKVKKSSEPDSKYQTIVTQQFDSSKGVPSGKIGFYNFSQANVYYNNFNATNLKTLSCSKYGTKWYLNNNDECEQTSLPDCETGYTKTNEGFCILSTTDGSVPQNDISIASVCNNGSKLGILNGNICVQQTECLETCPRGYVKIPGTNKCSQQTLYCSNGVLDEGNGLCKVTNTIWSVNKSYLQCDNDADTLYGKYQTDNYYCKSDVTEMVDGSGEKIFKVNKKPVINVPFSVVEKISDKFTRPLYVYAIDNKGVSSLDIKSLEMTFHYAKLDERQREYIEYSCPENTYPTQWFVTETPYYNFTPIDLITKNEERLLSGEDPSSFMPCMQDKFLDCENGDTTNNVFQGNQNIIYYDSIQQKNWNLKGEKSNEN